ncbi:DNA (cytosine-5-)-methyltransferase [Acetobacterium paludosum]|uniref:Cytosine-specific methyltransferase n=1 Tax=Acetobacterium paludosum TaxID=52693 RepID=A0A923I0D6_9FIRM|nr:DNA (cytosine-5-)-methyltransferase [Acetobacterium paludosum]
MNCLDLFAGAGGLSEGFRRCGFNIVAHVEKDRAASLTLKTREAYYYLKKEDRLNDYINYISNKITRDELYEMVPEKILNKVIHEEISDETYKNIFNDIDQKLKNKKNNKIEIIIGGPPCQAYSIAGRSRDPERMENDPRNYLYLQYLRFIKYYKPNYFVFENVMGIKTAKDGTIFEQIKKDMIDLGYKIDHKVLNAKDFGVLQSRKRVIIIGWQEHIDFKYPKFPDCNSEYTIKDLFEDIPIMQAGDKVSFSEQSGLVNDCLKDLHIKDDDFNYLLQQEIRPNREIDLEIYRMCVNYWNDSQKKLKYNELPEKLITQKNTKSFLDRFNVVPGNGISHTVVAHISKDGHYYIHPDIKQNRSISLREAARIQSFPDDYYFEDSRTAAFVQIGNAVPPLMGEKIAMVIKKAIKLNSNKSNKY